VGNRTIGADEEKTDKNKQKQVKTDFLLFPYVLPSIRSVGKVLFFSIGRLAADIAKKKFSLIF